MSAPPRSFRYITAERLLESRFPDASLRPHWDLAVLCFRDRVASRELVGALGGTPVGGATFWGVEPGRSGQSQVHEAMVGALRVVVVSRCLWGGPQASILVEELAALGVRTVLGFGAAGSLESDLPRGTQIAVDSALAGDGASAHYGDGPFRADNDLKRLLPEDVRVVSAVTMDAVYRETPGIVATWRKAGGQVVNMESAPFYAAAIACGLRALWVGHVSDVLGRDWEGWDVDRSDWNARSIEVAVGIAHHVAGTKG